VGPGYKALDVRLAQAVHLRFGLPAEVPVSVKRQIKRADNISAWLEAVQIAGFATEEADRFFTRPGKPEAMALSLEPRPPMEVKADFLARHGALEAQMSA
ncbi:MAG: hypothetical protein AAF245_07395, partial [Pseudomonadota bacterium]